MMYLQRRTTSGGTKQNTCRLTISERLSTNKLDNYLLVVLESDQQHTTSKTILEIDSSNVTLNERFDEIILIEGGTDKETTSGTFKVSPAGFYYYKIYEQTSSTNLDESDSSIVKLLEQGKMTVTDVDELTTIQHQNPTTNFIHIS